MNNNVIDDLMEDFIQVKRIIREMKYREEFLKDRLHQEMDIRQSDILRTPNFQVRRREQTQDYLRKEDTPNWVWNEYATPTTYWVMNAKPL